MEVFQCAGGAGTEEAEDAREGEEEEEVTEDAEEEEEGGEGDSPGRGLPMASYFFQLSCLSCSGSFLWNFLALSS